MARRVAEAWGFNNDKGNLFPPPSLLEDMEEGSEGAYDAQPQPTLRERPYSTQPLIIRPEYSGDFLDKLREEFKGKLAADPTNLLDFSMPSEMLKHQEQPYPRDLQDEFYEMNHTEDSGDFSVLKDYHKRDWDTTDAPEMSEDKILRMLTPAMPQKTLKKVFRSAQRVVSSFLEKNSSPDPQVVVAGYLMEAFPMDLEDKENIRVAKYLKDFERSMIFTKAKGWRKPDQGGVSVRLYRAEPKVGRWTFRTSSGGDTYVTIFQFIPEPKINEASKLHVRVSCTCPSFLFWGAQFNAVMGDYFYGKIRPKFTPPKKRDPSGRFLVCKHVLACIPVVSNYRLQRIAPDIKKKLREAPKIELEKKVPKEQLRIPKDLLHIGDQPNIKEVMKTWDKMTRGKKRSFIMGLENPEEVAFMAHRYPNTATVFVVEKLKEMASKEKKAVDRQEARDLLKEII